MGSAHSYTTKANLSRLSLASTESKSTAYTSRVNVSRLSGVNTDAFVRNASLLSRLGGEAALSSMVRFFYGKALHDGRTNRLFDAPDAATMENRIQQQIEFLRRALGGTHAAEVQATYAHLATMGISNDQFSAMVESIMATLQSQNVPPTVMSEVEAFCSNVRAAVVR